MPKEIRDHLARVLDLIDSVDEDSSNFLLLREAKNLLRDDLRKSPIVA